MSEVESFVCIFVAIMAFGIYGIIGALVGMCIDILDDTVMVASIFFWPILLPIHVIICLIGTIKEFMEDNL